MRVSVKQGTRAAAFAVGTLAVLLITGCQHLDYADPNPQNPFVFPGQTPAAPVVGQPPAQPPVNPVTPVVAQPPLVSVIPSVATVPGVPAAPGSPGADVLRPGDLLTITFSDVPPNTLPEYKARIPQDGKISLQLNVTVQAAGRTAAQLQQDIQNEYVPKYFRRLTVTVKSEERVYFVGGEVRLPSRQPYYGDMTVLRAIDTAQGFTDFANRKNIELRRANGQKFKIDWNKAVKDATLDLPVYPNDQVIVHKRLF